MKFPVEQIEKMLPGTVATGSRKEYGHLPSRDFVYVKYSKHYWSATRLPAADNPNQWPGPGKADSLRNVVMAEIDLQIVRLG